VFDPRQRIEEYGEIRENIEANDAPMPPTVVFFLSFLFLTFLFS